MLSYNKMMSWWLWCYNDWLGAIVFWFVNERGGGRGQCHPPPQNQFMSFMFFYKGFIYWRLSIRSMIIVPPTINRHINYIYELALIRLEFISKPFYIYLWQLLQDRVHYHWELRWLSLKLFTASTLYISHLNS